jgi:hypothetical protein
LIQPGVPTTPCIHLDESDLPLVDACIMVLT